MPSTARRAAHAASAVGSFMVDDGGGGSQRWGRGARMVARGVLYGDRAASGIASVGAPRAAAAAACLVLAVSAAGRASLRISNLDPDPGAGTSTPTAQTPAPRDPSPSPGQAAAKTGGLRAWARSHHYIVGPGVVYRIRGSTGDNKARPCLKICHGGRSRGFAEDFPRMPRLSTSVLFSFKCAGVGINPRFVCGYRFAVRTGRGTDLSLIA